MEETFTCSVCGQEHPRSELTEFDGQLLCPTCLNEETVICSNCGARVWQDDNAGDSDTPLCQSCYDRNYTSCAHCGRVIRYDDACYLHDDETRAIVRAALPMSGPMMRSKAITISRTRYSTERAAGTSA